MRILLVNSLYYPNIRGGAERSTQILAESLVQCGNDVHVASLAKRGEANTFDCNGVTVHALELANAYWPFGEESRGVLRGGYWHLRDAYNRSMQHRIDELLLHLRPTVVNTQNLTGFSVSVWPAVKLRGLPLIHTLRDAYLLCPRGTMFARGANCAIQCRKCKAFSIPRLRASGAVDVVTGISKFMLGLHSAHGYFPKAQRRVIYNAYEPEAAVLNKRSGASADGAIRFGFLGRLLETKGAGLMLDTFLQLPPGSARLVIAGTGDPAYEAELKRKVAGRGDIEWLGFVKPESLFSQIDVLLVPALWHEPLGRSVLEAQTYGVPVIGSRRGGIPELLSEETGWVFDPDQPGSLRDAMQACIETPPERMQMLRTKVLEYSERYRVEPMTAAYLESYDAAIRATRSAT